MINNSLLRNLIDRHKSPFPSSMGFALQDNSFDPEKYNSMLVQNKDQPAINPYSESFQVDFRIPECYFMNKPKELPESAFKNFPDSTLFYIFYSMPHDRSQLFAATTLQEKGWVYVCEDMRWIRQQVNNKFVRFNPDTW